MQTIEEQVKQLQAESAQLDQKIADGAKKAQEWQNRRKELKAKLGPLEQLNNEIGAAQTALDKQREAGQNVLATAKSVRDEQRTRLARELPQETRDAIETGVAKIDEQIASARQAVVDLQKQIGDAEADLATAQSEAQAAEAGVATARATLRQFAKPFQAAQDRVAKLTSDATAAADVGQARRAYYLTLELSRAIDELEKLADPNQQTELIKQIDESRATQHAALKALEDKTAELNTLKAELPNKERDLKTKEQQREDQIKPLLSAAPATSGGQQREAGQASAYPVQPAASA